jgi:hypothetical protein
LAPVRLLRVHTLCGWASLNKNTNSFNIDPSPPNLNYLFIFVDGAWPERISAWNDFVFQKCFFRNVFFQKCVFSSTNNFFQKCVFSEKFCFSIDHLCRSCYRYQISRGTFNVYICDRTYPRAQETKEKASPHHPHCILKIFFLCTC